MVLLFPALMSCGKFTDKFSRINGDVTRVHFSSRNDQMHGAAVLNGGLMIYFVDQINADKGKVFGFASEDLVNSKSVLLPNSQYKVYAYGWAGSGGIEGQVRCGYGDGGATITLSGASTTISITLNASNCDFGNSSAFGPANGANAASGTNFKVLKTQFCTGAAYPSCTPASTGIFYLRAELLAGSKEGSGLVESSDFNLSSACSTASSTASYLLSNFVIPIGNAGYFSPPLRLRFYSDSSCSTVSGTYQFSDGLRSLQYAASGASYYLDMVSTASTYYLLLLNQYF